MLQKLEKLYEGKAKRIYRTERPDRYLVEFKDDATAFNGAKKGTIQNKELSIIKFRPFFSGFWKSGAFPRTLWNFAANGRCWSSL